MAEFEREHDVVIVGAGPVGMMLAIELGRRDIDVHVIERRETVLRHPRAVGVHARTMEIFRQLGLADGIRQAGGLPLEQWSTFGYMTRLSAPDIGAIDLLSDPERTAAALDQSPELIAWCSQDVLVPFLRDHAATLPSVSITYGLTVTAVAQDAAGVTVTAVGNGTGDERVIRGTYLVGADGVRSTVRGAIGVDAPATPPLGHQLNVCFEADLAPFIGDRRYILWWIVNRDTQGAFLTYDGVYRWTYSWSYDPSRESLEDYTPERCAAVVRAAIGSPDVEVHIENVFPWTIDSAVAERFRVGRIFLAGDSAHRFPPIGGFGMNSGIQDAQNLAWKLASVLDGSAGAKLLETYDLERRGVAQRNVEQTTVNAQMAARAGWVMSDPEMLAAIEEPWGEPVRRKIADTIPLQEAQYWSYGQQFGFLYDSPAIVPDGSTAEPSTVTEYRPTAIPGAHAPHVWLRSPAGERLSTVDLLHSRFVVMSTPAGKPWIEAARRLAAERRLDLGAYTIGPGGDFVDRDGDWSRRYGIGGTGVVVVRPDGHVAYRADALGGRSPASALAAVLDRVLDVAPISPPW